MSKIQKALWKKLAFRFINFKLKPFTPVYNLHYAELARKHTTKPIICVGGFRSKKEIEDALSLNKTDLVSLCRPFICEHNFMAKLKNNKEYTSACTNCNKCAIMCDSQYSTKCYTRRR
jgi:2,4-dienoyl-CoA reductase-like NADH-dependent reductase (Old Yellow Enzyme family)